MLNRIRYEQRSTLDALEDYLTALGLTDIVYTDGYQPETTITNPQVVVTFPPSRVKTLQMGRVSGKDKTYKRRMQVDAYMESEDRAGAIVDAVMDFMDETCVFIKNESNTELGTLLCYDSETIYGEVIPPILDMPKNLRWRGVIRGEFEAHYPGA